jgi:transposase-like protein
MHAFRRNRVSSEKKIVAAALCNAGFSYRDVARLLGGFSFVAARDAFVAMMTSLPEVGQKPRREVALDGADVSVEGRRFHLWLARDVQSGDIITFHASPGPTAEDGARFLADVASHCSNRPRVRLGIGTNSPQGLTNLDLYFQVPAAESIVGRLERIFWGT